MKKLLVLCTALLALPAGGAWAAATLSAQDKTFVQQAAIGGMAEVQAGQMAEMKAKSPALKEYGQHMVAEHTPNNQELMKLAQQKGAMVPVALDPKHAQEASMLQKESGAGFDRTYVTGQVAGHQEMERVMQSEIQQGSDPDLKAFATKTLPVVQGHLKMAEKLQSTTAFSASNQ